MNKVELLGELLHQVTRNIKAANTGRFTDAMDKKEKKKIRAVLDAMGAEYTDEDVNRLVGG